MIPSKKERINLKSASISSVGMKGLEIQFTLFLKSKVIITIGTLAFFAI